MEAIEVIDTAVKVGLGAVIAGLYAVFSERQQYKYKIVSEFCSRRFQIIEKIANNCACFHKRLSDYWALMADYFSPDHKGRISKRTNQKIEEADIEFRNSFLELNEAEGWLYLLDEENAAKVLCEYAALASEFYKKVYVNSKEVNYEDLVNYRLRLRENRKNVLKAISEVFRNFQNDRKQKM